MGWSDLLLGPGAGADLIEAQDRQPGAQMRPSPTVRPGEEMPQRAAQPAPVRAQPQMPPQQAAPQPTPQPQSGIKLAPGYSVRNMGERGDIPVIVDPEGRNVSELDALPEAQAQAERALRRYGPKPPQEAVDAVNSYRRAIGQPDYNPAEMQPQQPSAPMAQPQPEAPARRSYADELLGPSAPATAPATKLQAPTDPNAEPDAPTWIGRRMQDVRGKRDPRFADVPAYQPKPYTKEDDAYLGSQFANVDDAARGDIISKQLGNRLLKREKDANGYEVITYRDDDGSTKQAYVNRPGLDMQDVSRTVLGAVPFMAVGGGVGMAARGAPLIAQAAGQALGAGATSIGGDAVAQEMGSKQGVDLGKAGLTAAAGGAATLAAPAISAVWRRFVTVPGLIDQTTGKLTPKGAAAAQQAGLDPATLEPEFAKIFAKEMAKTGDAQAAAKGAVSQEFGIPRTMGEMTQNPAQLLKEQRIRGGAYGEGGSRQMQTFDRSQAEAIAGNLVGDTAPTGATGQTIAKRLAPDRSAADFAKGNIGEEVRTSAVAARDAARKVEGEAWDKVGTITATDEALAELPAAINRALGPMKLTDKKTPIASEMARELDAFMGGQVPEKVAGFLKNNVTRDVDEMRRSLGLSMDDMAPGPDKTAATKIYRAFNDWLADTADKMVMTNPQGAANLVTARGISREVKDAFATNPRTAGDKIMAQVLEKADSAENVINALFTGPTAQIKQGTVEALQSLKGAYDRYLPADAAKRAWNDVRLAYWLRISQGKGGEAVGAQQFQTNLKTAMQTQGSVFNLLFSAEEKAAMQRLAMAVSGVEMKNLNRSWTAPGVTGFMKEGFDALLKAIGWNSPIIQTGVRTIGSPIFNAHGNVQASRATAQGGLAARRPPLLAPYAATAASRSED